MNDRMTRFADQEPAASSSDQHQALQDRHPAMSRRNRILGIIGPVGFGQDDVPAGAEPAERPACRTSASKGEVLLDGAGHLSVPASIVVALRKTGGHGVRPAGAAADEHLRERRLRPAAGRHPGPAAGWTRLVEKSLQGGVPLGRGQGPAEARRRSGSPAASSSGSAWRGCWPWSRR